MQVRYTVTLDDFVAYNLYVNRKSGVGRPGFLMIWLGFPALCAAGTVLLLLSEHAPVAALLIVAGAFWLFTFPANYRKALRRNVRTMVKRLGGHGIIGERALVLSEERLVAISETFRTEVRWEHVQDVEEVGDATYVFISGISAVILPRHGFDSDAEYEAVRDFALRKLDGRAAP
jgi:hypothetical protein